VLALDLLRDLTLAGAAFSLLALSGRIAAQVFAESAAPGLEHAALLRYRLGVRALAPLAWLAGIELALLHIYLASVPYGQHQALHIVLLSILSGALYAIFPLLFIAALYVSAPGLAGGIALLYYLRPLSGFIPLVAAPGPLNLHSFAEALEGQYRYAFAAATLLLLLLVAAQAARLKSLSKALAMFVLASLLLYLVTGGFKLVSMPYRLLPKELPIALHYQWSYSFFGTLLHVNHALAGYPTQYVYERLRPAATAKARVAVLAVGPLPFVTFNYPPGWLLYAWGVAALFYPLLIYWLLGLAVDHGSRLRAWRERRALLRFQPAPQQSPKGDEAINSQGAHGDPLAGSEAAAQFREVEHEVTVPDGREE
jgi:hypothetical protein